MKNPKHAEEDNATNLCPHRPRLSNNTAMSHLVSVTPTPTTFSLFPRLLQFFFKILFIFFLERGKGREKGRDRNISGWLLLMLPQLGTWPATQACAPTGNQTGDLLVRRLALNPLSHTSQGAPDYFDANFILKKF